MTASNIIISKKQELRGKKRRDYGGFPQLEKVYDQRNFFNIILTWASFHCDTRKLRLP